LAYLAAYDVHHAQVIGHCAPTTGIEPFTALVAKVMTREPYASARRVFWIVDNGCSHRGWTAAARLSDAFPNAVMIHTPIHASWLNQIEIYFSVIQRKLLTPDNVASLDELAEQITEVCPSLRIVAEWENDSREERPLWGSIESSLRSIAPRR
jgi:hypothetical protein